MSVHPVVPATSNLNTILSDELGEHKTKAAVLEEAPDSDGEGILKSKNIQRLQWVEQSLAIFCYVWWDRLAVFGHNRGQCKEELDLLCAQLSEWNALSKEQQSQIEDFKKKKVQTESRVHFLHIVKALYKERLSLVQMKIGASRIQSTSIFNMKKSANLIYEDIILIEVFANGNKCSTNMHCLFLLGYNSTRKRYAQCHNLPFLEGKAFKNGPALFWSFALVKILSHVLLGASSLTTGKKTESTNPVLWGKFAITPRAIAFATIVTSTSIASNYIDVSSDDNNIPNNNNISDENNNNDDDDDNNKEIMGNSTPPNMPIKSNAVMTKTAQLQVPVMHTKTVTFALPGTDTAKPVENTAQAHL
ncbi:hypothetical protein EDD18DRAFT_1107746 [Armillaria luteobubalina]|uniref:Uncharacterized protein n=1 Tax=Armillaria luteobubalina TaxID=153913 RepID=A0AA39Q025_9AGAR|nr:hypothetical protein EDD18DRAFT_1107746 [Armillaria luteobubalina]